MATYKRTPAELRKLFQPGTPASRTAGSQLTGGAQYTDAYTGGGSVDPGPKIVNDVNPGYTPSNSGSMSDIRYGQALSPSEM